MGFNARLRNPRNPWALPSPESLRELAAGKQEMPTEMQFRSWITWTRDLEDMVRDNRPGSQKRLFRDWSRVVPYLLIRGIFSICPPLQDRGDLRNAHLSQDHCEPGCFPLPT